MAISIKNTINGRVINMVGGVLEIDGKVVEGLGDMKHILEIRITEGSPVSINTDLSVTCGNVAGNVKAGEGVVCGNVTGKVDAGEGVVCGNIGGDVTAGKGVMASKIVGNVTAGGSVMG